MKKFLFKFITTLILIIFIFLTYLSYKGFETKKFNNLIVKQIEENKPDIKINNLEKIKIKLDYKNLSLFLSTDNTKIEYRKITVPVQDLKIYLDFISLIKTDIEAKRISFTLEQINISDLQKLAISVKPSNIKSFILNNVSNGSIKAKINLNFDTDLKINNYKIIGVTRNLDINFNKIKLKETTFNFIAKNEILNFSSLSTNYKGIPIKNGVIDIKRKKNLIINGSFNSKILTNNKKLKAILSDFNQFEILENKIEISANTESKFNIIFSDTLAVKDYNYSLIGNIDKANIKLKNKITSSFLKDNIGNIASKKTKINLVFNKNINLNEIKLEGYLKLDNKEFKKYKFSKGFKKNNSNYTITLNLNERIDIDILNYSKPTTRTANISSNFSLKKDKIFINNFFYKDEKNQISFKGMILKNNNLLDFKSIKVQTFKDELENNNFEIKLEKKIYILGKKFDSTNLLKNINSKSKNNFLEKINKEIEIKLSLIATKQSKNLTDFVLIGKIEKGKFIKILSKTEISPEKFLEISLKKEVDSKNKILEIYSDFPQVVLSDYNFFEGITGGKLLLNSSFNKNFSDSSLVIEKFKVKEAPAFAKLLALADFGGIADLLSGDGISFERLEINFTNDNKVLEINEIYAVGPSISILMEGYQDSSTKLVSLKGTMVPAKELNKLISKIPVLGEILIPKEVGEGLFGVSFKIKGLPDQIKTTVNPIKTLTPRFITKALEKRKKAK